MRDADRIDRLGSERAAPLPVPGWWAVVGRATGCGCMTGLKVGAMVGGVLMLVGRLWAGLIFGLLIGGIIGAILGLGSGILGGLVFALFKKGLSGGDPAVVRLAGAAVFPGVLLLVWCVVALSHLAAGQAVFAGRNEVTAFLVLSSIGGPPGALVAPRVLHGRQAGPCCRRRLSSSR